MFSNSALNQATNDTRSESSERIDVRARVTATVLVLIVMQLPLGNLLPGSGLATQVAREVLFCSLTALLLAYILLVERRPIASIGLKWPTWKSFAWGLAGAMVMIAGFMAIYLIIFPALGVQEAELDTVKSMPAWLQLVLIARAALFEETYYRGFAIERLTELTNSRALAALISLVAFTFAHLTVWGWPHLIVAAFGGIVLTGLYLFRRDLSACMIAHFVTNGVSFILA